MTNSPTATNQSKSQLAISRMVLGLIVVFFLLVFATRLFRLSSMNFERDETWSVWQTLGTASETIAWTPYDWSPTSYLLVFAWRRLTGIHPTTLRVLIILVMLLTDAVLFRVGKKMFGTRAAFLAMLAFSGFGYTLFLSTVFRAYLITVFLWIVALWICLFYFKRPNWRLGVLLAIALTLMFYMHATSLYAVAFLGLFTLVWFGRENIWVIIRAWIFPAILFALACTPEILSKLQIVPQKNAIVNKYIPYVAPQIRIGNMYLDFAGNQAVLWGVLFLIATALMLERFRVNRKMVALAVWLLAPVVLLWVSSFIDAFNPRHLSWIMVGGALWIGWGLSLLPRPALLAVGAAMTLCMVDSIPLLERYETLERVPLVTSFSTLKGLARAGDVLLIDTKCEGCIGVEPEEWDYFQRAYFPDGLPIIGAENINPVNGFRRIWYVAAEGKESPEIVSRLLQTRAQSLAFGDPRLLFRLFEAPPNSVSASFENGMKLAGVEILNYGGIPNFGGRMPVFHEGEVVKLRLFWTAEKPVGLDYSALVAQIDPKTGENKSQVDAAPNPIVGPKATSQWIVGQYYVEERQITLSAPQNTGEQDLYLSVYQWWDGVRIKASGVNNDSLLLIGKIYVKSL
jgi:hypothetical protein